MFLAYLYLLIFLFLSACCIKNSNLFNGFVQSQEEELKRILIPYWKVIMILYVLVITLQLGKRVEARRSNPMTRMWLAVKIPRRVQHSLQFFEERCVPFDYLMFNRFSMFLNGNDKPCCPDGSKQLRMFICSLQFCTHHMFFFSFPLVKKYVRTSFSNDLQ